jgi:hypothetical protein
MAEGPDRRLVVDIGGGSPSASWAALPADRVDSLHMGCVNWSLRFFPRGEIDKERFESAVVAARLEVRSLERHYRALGWSECVGSSGTILSIEQILHENGWNGDGITEKGLKKLKKELLEAGRCDKLDFKGLAEERRDVLPGGLAILIALFEGSNRTDAARSRRCARACSGTSSAASATRTCASSRSAAWASATPSTACSPAACSAPRSISSGSAARNGSWSARARPPSSPGPRVCTRSASRSRTRATTSTAPTSSPTPTCPASRARTSSCSRR